MTTQTLTEKVLRRIDEMTPQLSDGTISAYNVADFLEEAAAQIMATAPTHLLPTTDFAVNAVTDNGDGTGSVQLPANFVRLVEFKMQGWQRAVHRTITTQNPLYGRQASKVLRGGVAKPIVAINSNRLEYFSLKADTPQIATAKCIVKTSADKVPDLLVDAMCWLAASMVLEVKNEPTAAQNAKVKYNETLTTIYGTTDN